MKFITLNSQNSALNELLKSVENKDKLVLLIGKTGLGKSFLLEKLWEMEFKKNINFKSDFSTENSQNYALKSSLFDEADLKKEIKFYDKFSENKEKFSSNLEQNLNDKSLENSPKKSKIFLFSKPFFDENAFVSEIFESIFNENSQGNFAFKNTQNFELLHAKFQQNADTSYIFLMDEVGMYEESLLEKLRLLSDLPNLSFILALHKKQKVLEKEHFKSRIFKEICLKSLSINELNAYTQGKFARNFSKKELKKMLKNSGSNLRLIDKMLGTFCDLSEFYATNKHFKTQKKLLEMSAFHCGLLK